MGPELLLEVERQLRADLDHYGIDVDALQFDWSESCPEGHRTEFLGSTLEEQSYVSVITKDGQTIVDGWIDFIHGGDGNPLFVFWLFLSHRQGDNCVKVKSDNSIPAHIWEALSPESKRLCARSGKYDSRWSNDPRVLRWVREQ